MTKQQLRKQYKAARLAIEGHKRLQYDDLMLLQFQQMYFEEVTTLLTYWPMSNMAEPNMHLYNGYMRHMYPGLQQCFPKTNSNFTAMDAIAIHEETVYVTNDKGITEPKNGLLVAPTSIDLIFVPLLVCDEQGYRVGYGKGFYDKFIAQCRAEVLLVGFSYFLPVKAIADVDEWDIPLHYCITPERIIDFTER
jgi:5-formyltetrahydrofolate cyclo-ligase